MGRLRALVGLVVITLLSTLTGAGARVSPDLAANAASRPAAPSAARTADAYARLPLAFEPNVGQAPAGIDFVAHGPGYALALQGGSALLSIQAGAKVPENTGHPPSGRADSASSAGGRASRWWGPTRIRWGNGSRRCRE